MTDTSRHTWVDENEGVCLTLTRGLTEAEIVALLGLTAISPTPMSFDQAWSSVFPRPVAFVQLARFADYLAVIEDNGYLGSLPEYLGPLSTKGIAINAYWNSVAGCSFGYAAEGRIVRLFDPFGVNASEGDPLPEESDLDFGAEDSYPIGLALTLMERLADMTIDGREVLKETRPVYVAEDI